MRIEDRRWRRRGDIEDGGVEDRSSRVSEGKQEEEDEDASRIKDEEKGSRFDYQEG